MGKLKKAWVAMVTLAVPKKNYISRSQGASVLLVHLENHQESCLQCATGLSSLNVCFKHFVAGEHNLSTNKLSKVLLRQVMSRDSHLGKGYSNTTTGFFF